MLQGAVLIADGLGAVRELLLPFLEEMVVVLRDKDVPGEEKDDQRKHWRRRTTRRRRRRMRRSWRKRIGGR